MKTELDKLITKYGRQRLINYLENLVREEKYCPECKTVKGKELWYIRADGSWQAYCKECYKDINKRN